MVGSDRLGQLVAELDKGNYALSLAPKAQAPFLVTLGAAYESRLRGDLTMSDSGRPCADTVPDLANGVDFTANSWVIGPTFIRLGTAFQSMQGTLMKAGA
ncbi:unnamed protein product [Effrenium voratum]|nr:unnamed protein product [Effrenium voratum]